MTPATRTAGILPAIGVQPTQDSMESGAARACQQDAGGPVRRSTPVKTGAVRESRAVSTRPQTPDMTMADVFLSYAREDRAKAEQIATALTNAGYNVFWDIEIPPGVSWADFLAEKLSQSKAALVLWSKTSTASQWVREEARLARDKGKLIPVMVEECAPPFGFGEIQAANLADWNGEASNPHWKLLLEGIQRAVGSAPTGQASAPPLSPPAATGGWNAAKAVGDVTKTVSAGAGPVIAPAGGKRNWLMIGAVAFVGLAGLAMVLTPRGGQQGQLPAPYVGGVAPVPGAQTFSPAVADIVQKSRAAQVAAKVAFDEATRNAATGTQAATAAMQGDARYGTSQGPMGAVAGDLASLQAGNPGAVGIAMANGSQFAGTMQVNQANGGTMALNGTTNVQGGGWATGRYSISGGRAMFLGSGYIPDRLSLDGQEEGAADGSGTEGIGVLRYANGERYEGQYRSVGQGEKSQYFRNGLGVHYGANEQVLNAGRFNNDAYVGPQ